MFKKVLIANRGEIAVRVMRTLKEMNIKSVAVYSDIDRSALHVKYADEAIYIGESPANKSYLLMDKVLEAAKMTGAEAIHPGYGFLSENSAMSKACTDAGIAFIGPRPKAIEVMGNKTTARQAMQKAGVPVVPGTTTALKDVDEAYETAERMGYPILLKAAAGGGGKGMRAVSCREELESAFRTASSEAKNSFGDASMYVEKLIKNPRHIEFQVFSDNYGNCIHLNERECSIQRRHQKVIEETPAVVMTEEIRQEMGKIAVQAAKAVDYTGAGTIEFLFDEESNFYFLEMNTRLQVEHPITEMVTGLDLVKLQLEAAAGEKLNITQDMVTMNGAAVECRIYAEDPYNNFIPQPGKLGYVSVPGGLGVRDDSGIYAGCEIPMYYDPMISKLVVWAPDRKSAIAKMNRALEEYKIEGPITNIPFLRQILNTKVFLSGEYDTGYLDRSMDEIQEEYKNIKKEHLNTAIIAAAIAKYEDSGINPNDSSKTENSSNKNVWRKVGIHRSMSMWNR